MLRAGAAVSIMRPPESNQRASEGGAPGRSRADAVRPQRVPVHIAEPEAAGVRLERVHVHSLLAEVGMEPGEMGGMDVDDALQIAVPAVAECETLRIVRLDQEQAGGT